MKTYLALFLTAVCTSLVLTPIVRTISERFGWLDVPLNGRCVHRKPVPRLGGVALFLSVFCALGILPFLNNLVTQSLRFNEQQFGILLGPSVLVFLFGVYDDLRGTTAYQKFVAQVCASALFYALGGRIEALSVPLLGSVHLAPWLSFVTTMLWMVSVTNAFNLLDGVDGLAAGAALFASLVMLGVSLLFGHPMVAVVALAIAGATIGFLRYNFNPASIFMGDSGSLFLGFVLAGLSVQGAQKASTAVAVTVPLVAFGLPILDTSFSVLRRFIAGKPLFKGDREHVHHMLLARGWSQRKVVCVLYGVCALFGLSALFFVNEGGRVPGLMLCVIGVAIIFLFKRLRYHEVDEIEASMKRTVTDARLRMMNNIRIRRASRAMSEATTLSQIFDALHEMLEVSEFVYAVVQLGRDDDPLYSEKALTPERISVSLRKAEMRRGRISWSWERGDIDRQDVIGSSSFWSLRLPLSSENVDWGYINLYRKFDTGALPLDLDYLYGFFHREMVQAVERVLSSEHESGLPPVSLTTKKKAANAFAIGG